jgi:hypothetical protein
MTNTNELDLNDLDQVAGGRGYEPHIGPTSRTERLIEMERVAQQVEKNAATMRFDLSHLI